MATEDDLLKEAIAGTEAEIFSEATGADLPSDEGGLGNRDAEEMGTGLEGQHEGADDEIEAAGDDKGETDGAEAGADENADGKGERDPKTGQFTKKAETEDGTAGDEDVVVDPAATDLGADGKPKPAARVPVSEVITERKARQAAETRATEAERQLNEVRTSSTNEIAAINRRLDALLTGQTKAQPGATQQETAADDEVDQLFANPRKFIADLTQNITSTLERGVSRKIVEADLARTAEAMPDKFKPAYEAMTALDRNNPDARATVQRIWNSATPGADLIKWHAKNELDKQIGNDPAAYEARIRQETRDALVKDPEFKKQLLAELRGDAAAPGGDGKPRNITRMPRSLNSAAGGQSGAAGSNGRASAPSDGSDRGLFEHVMGGG